MYSQAYRLIQDCLDWEEKVGESWVLPERYVAMDKAMRQVARYVRTGKIGG